MQFRLAIKGLLDPSLRQGRALDKELLQVAGLNLPGWPLLVDTDGIQAMFVGDWKLRNAARNRQPRWVKVQLAVEFR